MTGLGTLLLLAVPFIPGLRDIPRLIPVHRLIWRGWEHPAGTSGAGPSGTQAARPAGEASAGDAPAGKTPAVQAQSPQKPDPATP